ncbi:peptidase domain-containing ABC transporter [Robiginitalea sp. M366]|uniref:peptidase domain-containing ABC transporter n=1 Tax=Robiginitalea aestuariiviva TaxID=3036903 RepID=UPI00240E168C|nr:peptidase domain-containing ABC transporter [Robiginitalea aestuariiviva]MDG1573288.1 peptidase domain-containing ABC transporter [Robiginitalea aestuariiviva]
MRSKFPTYIQPNSKDCGPACLQIILNYYGHQMSFPNIRDLCETTREGTSLFNLSEAAEQLGFKTICARISFEQLKNANLPCIVHWKDHHFVVVYKIRREKVYVSDPAFGLLKYDIQDFLNGWIGHSKIPSSPGIVLLLEETPNLKNLVWNEKPKNSIRFIYQYLFKYKNLLAQLVLGLLVGSILQLIFPFLTQSIVDIGIQNRDVNFIYLILGAQLMLFIGRTSVDIFRGWILLHLSTRVNISLVSDFFLKLMSLPIAYFDTKMTGDIMQRINDHRRIERLLTGSSLSILFSLFNLIIFGFVLFYYSPQIFGVYIFGSLIYVVWIIYFLKRRKELDYKRFQELSRERSTVIELINGMQEIKLHNAERFKRWNWEFIQIKLFKVSMKNLRLEQTQGVGSSVINELKNIIITFLSAVLVIEGKITLGMMLSIQYIIGQLNAPIGQLVSFIRTYQDAKISIERLAEVHEREDEESNRKLLHKSIRPNQDIVFENVSFNYLGSEKNVLTNINLVIPANKTTAIVGSSGSGKSTLVKLMLQYYEPNNGNIRYGNHFLNQISPRKWREHCGTVMQEGFLFNDTIAANIALGAEYIDRRRLKEAAILANIDEFINSLPQGFNTLIGNEGIGISTGQKQRLFLARAAYKSPFILFFDEATSSLDARNEFIIMKNLKEFFKNKTAVIIAHRLSTVKNADQIIVLENGAILEKGTHHELVQLKGAYFNLVKNQLDLQSI